MIILNNFLNDVDYNFIKNGLNQIYWGYLNESVDTPENFIENERSEIKFVSSPTFRHMFIWQGKENSHLNGNMFPFYNGLKEQFGEINLRSVFANLLPKTKVIDGWNNYFSIPHVDVNYPDNIPNEYNCFTALYYVNDGVGDTLFFKEKQCTGMPISTTNVTEDFRVSPNKNTMVIWDKHIYHSAPAYVPETRIVVNFNFLVKK